MISLASLALALALPRQCNPVKIISASQLSADVFGTPKSACPLHSSDVHAGERITERNSQGHTMFFRLPDPDVRPATCRKINGGSISSHEIDGVKFCPKATEVHGRLSMECVSSTPRRMKAATYSCTNNDVNQNATLARTYKRLFSAGEPY